MNEEGMDNFSLPNFIITEILVASININYEYKF